MAAGRSLSVAQAAAGFAALLLSSRPSDTFSSRASPVPERMKAFYPRSGGRVHPARS